MYSYSKKYNIKGILYSLMFFSRIGFKKIFGIIPIKDYSTDNDKRHLLKEGSYFRYPFNIVTEITYVNVDHYYIEDVSSNKNEVGKIIEKTNNGQIEHIFVLSRENITYEYKLDTDSLFEYFCFRLFFFPKNLKLWMLQPKK